MSGSGPSNISVGGILMTAMLVLGFGPLDWTFPWWLWVLCFVDAICALLASSLGIWMRQRDPGAAALSKLFRG